MQSKFRARISSKNLFAQPVACLSVCLSVGRSVDLSICLSLGQVVSLSVGRPMALESETLWIFYGMSPLTANLLFSTLLSKPYNKCKQRQQNVCFFVLLHHQVPFPATDSAALVFVNCTAFWLGTQDGRLLSG